jgi:COMPASS component SPP1
MCAKKKCKPHNGWSAILTKTVRHDMKELAAQAKEMLDAEQRVRDGAAGRWGRRRKEGNCVVGLCGGGGGDLEEGEGVGVGVGMDICN